VDGITASPSPLRSIDLQVVKGEADTQRVPERRPRHAPTYAPNGVRHTTTNSSPAPDQRLTHMCLPLRGDMDAHARVQCPTKEKGTEAPAPAARPTQSTKSADKQSATPFGAQNGTSQGTGVIAPILAFRIKVGPSDRPDSTGETPLSIRRCSRGSGGGRKGSAVALHRPDGVNAVPTGFQTA